MASSDETIVINTDVLESGSDSIASLAESASKALSSANSYAVTSVDFDFSPAISAIKTNMQNINDKVKASSDILKKIAAIHANLQNSQDSPKGSTTTNTGTPTYSTPTYSSSPSYSSPTYSTLPTSSTPTTTSPTSPLGESSRGTNIPSKTDKYDYAELIRAGKIELLTEESIKEKTKDKTKLIIRISKDDPNYDKYIEMVYNVAKMYGISVGIVLIPQGDDKTVKVSLVKNGEEKGKVEGEITEEKIKALFENAPDDVKKDYHTENEFVYYKQGDYGNAYAGETIAAAGCGPTAAAMVLTYLTGDEVNPPTTAAYSTQHGFAVDHAGTTESLFPSIGKAYGLNVQKESQTASNIVNSLKEGNVIIAHMGPGEFTKGGHYIVLRGLNEQGQVLVADPANPARNKYYPASIFEQQRQGSMYSFSVPV